MHCQSVWMSSPVGLLCCTLLLLLLPSRRRPVRSPLSRDKPLCCDNKQNRRLQFMAAKLRQRFLVVTHAAILISLSEGGTSAGRTPHSPSKKNAVAHRLAGGLGVSLLSCHQAVQNTLLLNLKYSSQIEILCVFSSFYIIVVLPTMREEENPKFPPSVVDRARVRKVPWA